VLDRSTLRLLEWRCDDPCETVYADVPQPIEIVNWGKAMSTGISTENVVETPWMRAPNLHGDSLGSIHDEDEAKRIGFRAAPIGANTLLAFYTPVLVDLFGQAWHERGFLSLDFLSTIDEGNSFRILASQAPGLPEDERVVTLVMEKEDGRTANMGYAGVTVAHVTAVPPWQRPDALPLAGPEADSDVLPRRALGSGFSRTICVRPEHTAAARKVAADSLAWYQTASPWGGAIVPMNTYHNLGFPHFELEPTRKPSITTSRRADPSRAGMNARLQLVLTGPMICGEPYSYRQVLIEKGFSKRTAFSTVEYVIESDVGETVAVGRQKVRWFVPKGQADRV